jgi:hypothetical protein
MPDKFDPNKHLRNLKGADYLETKFRLVWLREVCPDAVIETEIVEHSYQEGFALFRARVTTQARGSATGWGSETRQDFRDYLEKAETKALGRALAALGFGTAFAAELDEGDAPVDSPVARSEPATRPAQRPATANEASGKPEPKQEQKPAQPGHIRALFAAANEFKWPDEAVKALGKRAFGVASTNDLTPDQVASLRTRMKRCREIANQMDTLWSADGIAEHLAECGVGTVLEMTGEQLTGTEALLKQASADLGLVAELYAATR